MFTFSAMVRSNGHRFATPEMCVQRNSHDGKVQKMSSASCIMAEFRVEDHHIWTIKTPGASFLLMDAGGCFWHESATLHKQLGHCGLQCALLNKTITAQWDGWDYFYLATAEVYLFNTNGRKLHNKTIHKSSNYKGQVNGNCNAMKIFFILCF